MKKFLLGAFAALALGASTAFAGITPVGTDTDPTSEYQVWCYNTTNSQYDVCIRAVNGANPYVVIKADDLFLDSGGVNSIGSILAAKASAADLATLSSTVAGIGTPFSGAYADLTGKPSLFSGAYADLSGKPTLFDGAYSSLSGKPSTFTPSTHTHAESDVTGLVSDLAGKASTSTVIGTGATLGTAATNASTTQLTNYNLVSGLLGVANGLNDANAAQNDLAAKYNDLAAKYNTLLAMLKARTVPAN